VDPIEKTIDRLAAQLPPCVLTGRTGLLKEARAGLQDAAEAYRDAGCSDTEARERAVAEFGNPTELSADYIAQLRAGSARRAAVVLGVGYLAILTAWMLAGRLAPDTLPGGGSTAAASSFPVIGAVAFLTMVGTLALSRSRARRREQSTSSVWAVGVVGLGCAVATLYASYLVQPWGVRREPSHRPDVYEGSGLLVSTVELFSGVMTAAIIITSLSCLATLRSGRRGFSGAAAGRATPGTADAGHGR
jgi:hypothetical protein